MLAYIEGKITYKSPSLIHINISGIAFEIQITLRTYEQIQNLEECRIYTHIKMAEDAWTIYGFADELERLTFRQLININGVGPGTARIMLSSLSPKDLEQAVIQNDSKILEKIKGIGSKTAQRIILELRGKIDLNDVNTSNNISNVKHNTKSNDALIALTNLGVNKTAAENAINKITEIQNLPVEEIVKQALRNL